MKKLISPLYFFLVFMLIGPVIVFAQTEKGKMMIGGGIDINSQYQGPDRYFNFVISPSVGVLVVKNLGIGGRYGFNVHTDKAEKNATYVSSIGPFVKYYFGKKMLKGFASAQGSYAVYTRMHKGSVTNKNGYTAGLAIGCAYFLNEHISMESSFSFNSSGYEGNFPLQRFGLGLGFQMFLDKKKKE